jgi:hypothetical protein
LWAGSVKVISCWPTRYVPAVPFAGTVGEGLAEDRADADPDADGVAVVPVCGEADDDVQALRMRAARMALMTPQVRISRFRLAADTDAS